MSFKDTVRTTLAHDTKIAEKLAHEFQCGITTPERWAYGTAVPHPHLQKLIINFIHEQQDFSPS